VGSERLSLLRHCVIALAVSAIACNGATQGVRPAGDVKAHGRHLQIFHAMRTSERQALVDRLRERDPAPPSSRWTVNEDALVRSLTVVDPFAGFLRRARRDPFVRPIRTGGSIGEVDAASCARDFVKRNADLLGLPRHVVPGLAEHVRASAPSDHASPRTAWVVRFDAAFATKGYEGFKEIDNVADVEVLVDDDGEVSSFVNRSRIHPHLTIDTKPVLAQDDPRVLSKLLGRKLFALDAPDGSGAGDLAGVQALRRIQLGEVRAEDVTHMQLVIHVSAGPQLAWLTYRLGYFVEVAKPAPPDAVSDSISVGVPAPPQFFFFRYVVDADTGDVLEDARAPLSTPVLAEPP
jgi:hypothetical protein